MRRYKKFEIILGTEDDELDWNDLEFWKLAEILPIECKVLVVDSFLVKEEKWMDDLMIIKKLKKTS